MGASDAGRQAALRSELVRGLVIPAHPLALTGSRRLDERRQVALTRYYCDAGAGGIAVGVHTPLFAIRGKAIGLFQAVLDLAMRAVREWRGERPPVMIAGVVGRTEQAVGEAELAASRRVVLLVAAACRAPVDRMRRAAPDQVAPRALAPQEEDPTVVRRTVVRMPERETAEEAPHRTEMAAHRTEVTAPTRARPLPYVHSRVDSTSRG